MKVVRAGQILILTAILGFFQGVESSPHGDEGGGHGGMIGMNVSAVDIEWSDSFKVLNYFRHPEHTFWIYSHIICMVLAWCIALPIAVMVSIAKSRYTLLSQGAFFALNGIGVFVGTIFNANTPDLYENNAHHKMGWIFTWFSLAWVLIGIVNIYAKKSTSGKSFFRFRLPSYQQLDQNEDRQDRRWSNDSGNETGATLSPSSERGQGSFSEELPSFGKAEDEEEVSNPRVIQNARLDKFLTKHIRKHAIGTPLLILRIIYSIFERTLLLLGFAALLSGLVTYGGLFRNREVFTGLAHFVKGGIFFWLGVLTIARWSGAFADLGWAWNVKPTTPSYSSSKKSRVPSAEWFESALIALYGISNVWLEHLNAAGEAWSPMDYEHLSITILFFGGGLLGMLIESSSVARLLNMGLTVTQPAETHFQPEDLGATPAHPTWTQPTVYPTPMNVVPALTILLLGLIMSAHVQHSVLAQTMHTYWGSLFAVAAAMRIATYVLHYLNPPVSHFPSRPPTEILTGFCLVAGGLLFMMSARDITDVLEGAGGDAMIAFVIGMGFTAVVCAMTVASMAVKGWAVAREHGVQLRNLRGQGVAV